MRKTVTSIKARRGPQRGATATEYALLALCIAAAIVFVVFTFGGEVTGLFDEANSSWDSATSLEE